jgi:putative ABC transport system permease protein
VDDIIQDLRYAARQLVLHPGFTAILVLTLALGIGANTAVFSVVDGVVLRPLPYPQPDRLTVAWTQFPSMDLMEFPASWPEYQDYRKQSRSFDEMGLWGRTQRTLTGDDDPERLDVAYFTWTMFPVLGVEPALGRVFTADEDVDGRDDVVVLSHGLWERRFGSDPSIVGKTVQMDGSAVTVLGVMPEGFAFPDRDTQAWIPVGIDPANPPGRASHFGRILGRLAPGVTLDQASTELRGLIQRWQDDPSLGHTWSLENHPAFLRPLHEQLVGNVRRSLFVLLGAVGLVLLIACANVANLLLVRGEGRLREISIRSAMGAGRGRIVRQLVTESLLVAALGGVAGLALAHFGLEALLALAPSDLPRADGIRLDGTVLAFSGGVSLLAGFLFGLAPALQTRRMDVQGALREEGRGGTASRGRFRLRQLLVVSQTALAVVLLIAAGLLIQSFWRLQGVDPGFRSARVLAFSVSLPQARYPDDQDVTGFYRELLPRMATLPGVTSAGLVRTAPLSGSLPPNDIEFESRPRTETDGPPLNADIQVVSAGYFATMGIPLLRGRAFDRTDNEESEPVAVVDEVLARRFFEEPSDAIGERIRQPGTGWARIVGIVGAVHQESLADAPRAQLYLLHAQSPITWYGVRDMTVLLRTGVEPLGLVAAVRQQVKELDPDLPVYQVTTMAQTVARSTASQRFTMFLQLVFASVALLLAVVGIYGVLSYSVAQRTREIGIRLALGAERARIMTLVVGQGMALAAIAVCLGVLGALATAQVLASLLFGVSPRDPLTYGGVVAVLLLVSLVACWYPARRASAVSPQTALRAE